MTGTVSFSILYESLLVESMLPPGLQAKIVSKSSLIRSLSGASYPKHSCETSSIKNTWQLPSKSL